MWRDLLFQRIEDRPSAKTEYILSPMTTSDVSLPMAEVVVVSVRSERSAPVGAATTLGYRWLDASGQVNAELAKLAYPSCKLFGHGVA